MCHVSDLRSISRVCVCVCFLAGWGGKATLRSVAKLLKPISHLSGEIWAYNAHWTIFGHDVNPFGKPSSSPKHTGTQGLFGVGYRVDSDQTNSGYRCGMSKAKSCPLHKACETQRGRLERQSSDPPLKGLCVCLRICHGVFSPRDLSKRGWKGPPFPLKVDLEKALRSSTL